MSDIEKSLEQLFSEAKPRPLPDDTQAAVVREALRDEWRSVTGKRQTRKRVVNWAVAASVLVVVFSLLNTLRVPLVDVVQVASIQKSFGSIFLIGEESVMTPVNTIEEISVGQKIATGTDAGIALAWSGGGSLRLDENTTVEFQDDNTVYLHSGQIYFDSMPSSLMTGIDAAVVGTFNVDTDFGRVFHIGTQFMAGIDDEILRVSVREGLVAVDSPLYPETASRGEQLVYSGRSRPNRLSITEYGDDWRWIGRTSPAVSVDGRTINEFLTWVGRELGREIEYDDSSKEVAMTYKLKGNVDKDPAVALKLRMKTAGFNWRFEKGKIYVSNTK